MTPPSGVQLVIRLGGTTQRRKSGNGILSLSFKEGLGSTFTPETQDGVPDAIYPPIIIFFFSKRYPNYSKSITRCLGLLRLFYDEG